MYKVFINDKRVLITKFFNKIFPEPNKKIISCQSKEELITEIENIETGKTKEETIIIQSENIDILIKDFHSLFRNIEAAGGVVKNDKNEILFIYRLNRWDLPKGKIEKNEKIKETAMREVMEETGLKAVIIRDKINTTYHSYIKNKERLLKKTYWFEMYAPGEQALTPQVKEKITEVKWFRKEDFEKAFNNTYMSIKDMLEEYLGR